MYCRFVGSLSLLFVILIVDSRIKVCFIKIVCIYWIIDMFYIIALINRNIVCIHKYKFSRTLEIVFLTISLQQKMVRKTDVDLTQN